MNPEIIRCACSLSEAESEAGLLKENYRAAMTKQSGIKARLEGLLLEAEIYEPIAICLDDSEILVCLWEGEGNYSFSLVRSYS